MVRSGRLDAARHPGVLAPHTDELLGRQVTGAALLRKAPAGDGAGSRVVPGAGAGADRAAEGSPTGAVRGEHSTQLAEHGQQVLHVYVHGGSKSAVLIIEHATTGGPGRANGRR